MGSSAKRVVLCEASPRLITGPEFPKFLMISSMPKNQMRFGAQSLRNAHADAHSIQRASRFLKLFAATSHPDDRVRLRGALGSRAMRPSCPRSRQPGRSSSLPPGGPCVVAVLQRTYQNGISQEIALSTASLTAGQNAFYVSLLNNTASNFEIPETLPRPPLTPGPDPGEMEERIRVDMRTSLVYVQNKFGPFGFATGRSATGDLCLYAWQQIEPTEPPS